MRYAVSFMQASAGASTRFRVASLSGQCRDTKSDSRSTRSTDVVYSTPGSAARSDLLLMSTDMPNANARFLTRLPMPPDPPTKPSVLPASSKCDAWRRSSKFARSPAARRRTWSCRELLKLSKKVRTRVATASVLYAGTFMTVIPRARQASMSTLLNPVPASQSNFTELGSLEITAAETGTSLVTTTSTPSNEPTRSVKSASDEGSVSKVTTVWSSCSAAAPDTSPSSFVQSMLPS
mmetsp:Transcript_76513/g.153623  ORF Transcript_76513/g.153623 Transcript_76513/m.153623 type:complete len:236 (+) Transcript_76513:734-1441(+)